MEKDRVMGKFVNGKIMDYKTPFVKELQSSIQDQNARTSERFIFNQKRRSSQDSKLDVNGSLAISNLKNGTTHIPVAPSNPNKPLFHG